MLTRSTYWLLVFLVFSSLVSPTEKANAEAGFIKIGKANLADAKKHGVSLSIKPTKSRPDVHKISIRITPIRDNANYGIMLIIKGEDNKGSPSYIKLAQHKYDGKILADFSLAEDVMKRGLLSISGIDGKLISGPESMMIVLLQEFIPEKGSNKAMEATR